MNKIKEDGKNDDEFISFIVKIDRVIGKYSFVI